MSFLSTSIGYIGAFSMVIGFSYYVLNKLDLSWKLIEPIGYIALAGLFYLPFSTLSNSLKDLLRLTTFLALIALPIMIILTLILHFKNGDKVFLAGSFICLLTATLSYFYGYMLDSKIISFYAVILSWTAIQFFTAQLLKNEDLRFESIMEISALMSFLFMGFGLFHGLNGSIHEEEQRIYSYIVVLGLFAYLLTTISRTLISNGSTDLLLIISVLGLYYLIDINSSLRYIEIPLSLSTTIYIFSKLFMNFFTRERFPLFLMLVGAVLYGLSILYQMRVGLLKSN
jgi:hypothetical protein